MTEKQNRQMSESFLIGALLAVVGGFLDGGCERSLLYDPGFTHMFRKGTAPDAD